MQTALCGMLRLLGRVFLGRRHHQHGTRRQAQDMLRHAAKEDTLKAAAAMRTNENDLSMFCGGPTDDFTGRLAGHDETLLHQILRLGVVNQRCQPFLGLGIEGLDERLAGDI